LSNTSLGGLVPRPEPKPSAPRVEVVRFDPQRKRDLLGPGGVVLRQLEDRYGASLDLTQEGQCLIFGNDRTMVSQAKAAVMDLVCDVLEGEVYEGTVIELHDFGAIVELLRNKEGILHVSQMNLPKDDTDSGGRRSGGSSDSDGTLGLIRQHLQIGQRIGVRCTAVDPINGKIKLSCKGLPEKRKD
jgi:polyribonucleotide nucleotidyltransferase